MTTLAVLSSQRSNSGRTLLFSPASGKVAALVVQYPAPSYLAILDPEAKNVAYTPVSDTFVPIAFDAGPYVPLLSPVAVIALAVALAAMAIFKLR